MKQVGANQRINPNIELILTLLSSNLCLEPFSKTKVFFVFNKLALFQVAYIDMEL